VKAYLVPGPQRKMLLRVVVVRIELDLGLDLPVRRISRIRRSPIRLASSTGHQRGGTGDDQQLAQVWDAVEEEEWGWEYPARGFEYYSQGGGVHKPPPARLSEQRR